MHVHEFARRYVVVVSFPFLSIGSVSTIELKSILFFAKYNLSGQVIKTHRFLSSDVTKY